MWETEQAVSGGGRSEKRVGGARGCNTGQPVVRVGGREEEGREGRRKKKMDGRVRGSRCGGRKVETKRTRTHGGKITKTSGRDHGQGSTRGTAAGMGLISDRRRRPGARCRGGGQERGGQEISGGADKTPDYTRAL